MFRGLSFSVLVSWLALVVCVLCHVCGLFLGVCFFLYCSFFLACFCGLPVDGRSSLCFLLLCVVCGLWCDVGGGWLLAVCFVFCVGCLVCRMLLFVSLFVLYVVVYWLMCVVR